MTDLNNTEIQAFATGDRRWGLPVYETDDGKEYVVALSEAQADKAVREEIREQLWSFQAWFIVEHCDVSELNSYEINDFIKCLKQMQETMCESSNSIVYQLIMAGDGLESFVEDAIATDGRGHFLAGYDFKELELSDVDDDLQRAILEGEEIDPTDLVAVNNVLLYRIN